jgi:hypothetical protein
MILLRHISGTIYLSYSLSHTYSKLHTIIKNIGHNPSVKSLAEVILYGGSPIKYWSLYD